MIDDKPKKTVVVKLKKKQKAACKKKKAKEKKPNKNDLLLLEGLKYYNFVLNIESTTAWIEKCQGKGLTPNQRIAQLIKIDMEQGVVYGK